MHLQGRFDPKTIREELRAGRITYSDTKLHDLILSMAVARHRKDVLSNAVHPGWVPTKMGGKGAPDSLEKGYETQVWLSVSEEEQAKVSGKYFFHKKPVRYAPEADDRQVQENFLELCAELTGVKFIS
jgi:NAD(P)-dependent dehydrogenase (short-subunit alcohol dehydrogenase family)